jgi:PKD repeat protein
MKTIKLMYLVLFVALFVGSCGKTETPAPNPNPTPNPTGSLAVANFTPLVLSGVAPLQVSFTNSSTSGVTYKWTFQGGNPATSTDTNPTVTFATAGTYTVTLVAIDKDGKESSPKTATITVTAPPPPVANFTFTPNAGAAPLLVAFTNTSTNATSYLWDFGNGQTSTAASPSTTYAAAGTYSIRLTATSANGQTNVRTANITVTAPVVQTYTINDKWIAADHNQPKSYRNHHYTFDLSEETKVDISITSSIAVGFVVYNGLDIVEVNQGSGINNFTSRTRSSSTVLKAGKYRIVALGVKDAEANYVLTVTGKLLARPTKIETQYQRIVGSWTYSDSDKRNAMSARNRHYDIEVTQDTQIDLILTSSVGTRMYMIDALGFRIIDFPTPTFSTAQSIDQSVSVRKGKYRIIASTGTGEQAANFIFEIFGHFANVTEIKSIEQTSNGAWTASANSLTSTNNPRYNLEVTQESVVDILVSSPSVDIRYALLNERGDVIADTGTGRNTGWIDTRTLPKGVYTIVVATRLDNQRGNFSLYVYGHFISNFRLK